MKLEEMLDLYIRELKTYNQTTNIYSEKAYDHLSFHVQDSLQIAKLIGNSSQTVVDMGSGCGLPAVVLALKNDQNTVFAVESKERKCRFLRMVKETLVLKNLTVVCADINQFLHTQPHIDVITAKAFAPISKIQKIVKKAVVQPRMVIVPISERQHTQYRHDSEKKFEHIHFENQAFYYFIQ